MNIKIKKLAFTLAEVLITLGIIGVIAAITIPALLNNYQDTQYKSAWKKSYATMSSIYASILNDIGGDMTGNENNIGTLYAPYLRYLKYCSRADTGNCWHSGGVKYLDNTDAGTGLADVYEQVYDLSDGSFIAFHPETGSCTLRGPRCGFFIIDVNGFKQPNTIGKDIFYIYYRKNDVTPWPNTGADVCDTNNTGKGCSSLYLMQ